MKIWPFYKVKNGLVRWLTKEYAPEEFPACDFKRLRHELRPCDVLLIEGHSRVSEIIKAVTKSNWSHSVLYIGRLDEIRSHKLREKLNQHYRGNTNEQLVIEGILGKGIIVSPLTNYHKDHIRICRADAISLQDSQRVMAYAINALGKAYDVRHIFDLLRLLFPFLLLPKHLFSSLFKPKQEENKKQICSSLLAEAFGSVKYPIMPKIVRNKEGKIQFIPRNPNLFTPKDFDYSPYFSIIKYPLFGLDNTAVYRQLPWTEEGIYSNDQVGFYFPEDDKKDK